MTSTSNKTYQEQVADNWSANKLLVLNAIVDGEAAGDPVGKPGISGVTGLSIPDVERCLHLLKRDQVGIATHPVKNAAGAVHWVYTIPVLYGDLARMNKSKILQTAHSYLVTLAAQLEGWDSTTPNRGPAHKLVKLGITQVSNSVTSLTFAIDALDAMEQDEADKVAMAEARAARKLARPNA